MASQSSRPVILCFLSSVAGAAKASRDPQTGILLFLPLALAPTVLSQMRSLLDFVQHLSLRAHLHACIRPLCSHI